jgi:hypothetical protein
METGGIISGLETGDVSQFETTSLMQKKSPKFE